MTDFEKKWYDLFMRNMVTTSSLKKLVISNKLSETSVYNWEKERLETYGY